MAEPSAKEQLALELINEARLDPMGNAARYISSYATQATSNDPDINQALDFFNVNGPALKAALEALTPVEPLAWNNLLADAATGHSQNMDNQNKQEHVLDGNDPGDRITAAGYNWNSFGENIFLNSENPLHGHAAFMVDWGSGPNGMQNPPGHRDNIMDDTAAPWDFREIGIGIVDRGNGKESTTQNFGTRLSDDTKAYVLGVAYDDSDANNFYSVGEGIAGLNVAVGAASTATTISGGYTLIPAATGSQNIVFSNGGLAASATYQATLVANHNYKLDIVNIGSGNPVLRTSLSGILSGSGVLHIVGIGMIGLELTANIGNNSITGAKGDDKMSGGADNDTLNGGIGDDKMTGGIGADTYMYGANFGADTITDFNRGEGDEITLLSFGAIQSVVDLFAKATVTEAGGNTEIDFGGGNTLTLNNVAKNSLVDSDFNFGPPVPVITGTGGKDTINGSSSPPLQTTNDDEIIFGLDGDDVIDALGGADFVEGGDGNDNMKGGAGIDTLSYEDATAGVTVSLLVTAQQDTKGAGKDTVSQFENILGSVHADKLTGDKNDNKLEGAANDDILDGGLGNDTLLGGNGDDLLIGGVGSDTIDGGAEGILGDTASFAGITVAVSASLAGGAASYKIGLVTDTDTLLEIENLIGGSGADQLFGDGNANKLDGAAGNDKLFGDAGNDTLIGGIGNDELQGDDGDDLLIGGAGADKIDGGSFGDNDTVSYVGSAAGVTVVLDGVTLGKGGDAAGDLVSLFVEHVIGSAKDDKIFAVSGKNYLQGGAGNDTLAAGGNDDKLDGGAGNDMLIGDAEADELIGGDGIDTASYAGFNVTVDVTVNGKGFGGNAEGDQLFEIENLIGTAVNDTLTGDVGVNSLTGGGGDDQLRDFDAGDGIDVLIGGAGNDTITGHAGDKLDGGADTDTLIALGGGLLPQFVTVDLSKNLFTEGKAKSTLVSFEHVTGSDAHDTLTGTAGINKIIGNNGNDVIQGLAGADILDGDNSNIPGNDTVVYAMSNAAVTIDLIQQGTKSNANDAPLNKQFGGHADGDRLYGFENVVGSKFNDVLTGDNFDNIIEGGLGNDILDGGASGANGNTVSYAGATANVTVSLTIVGTEQNTGGGGKDKISNFVNILGGKGADILTGDAGNNTIDGGAGNDLIQGGDGDDILRGGDGTGDTVTYANASEGVVVNLLNTAQQDTTLPIVGITGAGKDTLSEFENLTGSGFNDSLIGNTGANAISGGKGDDRVVGWIGNDVLDGGEGTDSVSFTYLTNTQHLVLTLGALNLATGAVAKTSTSGVAGDIDAIMNIESVLGGSGNDKITGNAGSNALSGWDGNDRLFGLGDADFLHGENGDDFLEGGAGADLINGWADNDTASYFTSKLAVTIELKGAIQGSASGGDADGDQIFNIENVIGSAKNDTLKGDVNNNVIEGGLGDDALTGGGGIDTLSYAGATAAVTASLALQGGLQSTGGGGKDTASGFQNLWGGNGADKLFGDVNANEIRGGGGNDTINGGGNNDTFFGDAGDDTLTGGAGNDTFFGGAGKDKITGGDNSDSVKLSGSDGVGDVIDLGGHVLDVMEFFGSTPIALSNFNATASQIEVLNANNFDVTGTTGADNIDFSGFDTVNNLGTMDGLGGNDKITGTLNADTIIGGAGNDILDGKAGADHLHGGLGTDTLTGGADADTFHIKLGEGFDTIKDFLSGTDEIELDLPAGAPGTFLQASGAVPVFNGPGAAIIYDQDDGKVYYDTGPTSVHIATLTGAPTLALLDFTFV